MVISFDFNWQTPPSVMIGKLDEYKQRLLQGLAMLADTFAQAMQAAAQAGAPWNDRTTNARSGLRGLAVKAATMVTIYLFHTVHYGPYLELGTSKMVPRPIIMPTLQAHFGPIMAALRALVGG